MHKHLTTILFVTMLSVVTGAQDWNQWRGPQRTGVTPVFKAPATWPERPTRVWTTQAGLGHSSPIVANGRVFLFSRIGEQEALTAFDLPSGKQLWRQSYDAPYSVNPAAASHGKGPKSTPVFQTGRVFTLGISGILSAWDGNAGRLLWRKDFRTDFPSTSPDFGVAMSPLVAGGKLIVHVGGAGAGALLALDPARGDIKWSWKGDGPGYASPVLASFGGAAHVITQTQRQLVALTLADGKLAWQVPFTTEYDQNSITPVVFEDTVIFSGVAQPLAAVRVFQEGGTWLAKVKWRNEALPLYMSTPVVSGGHLYGLSHRNRGQLFCVDVRTGNTVWTTRGREGENAALVLAGDTLIVTTTEGELVIAKANPAKFDAIKRYTIADSPVWAHPAMVAGGLLIKDAETLAFWRF
jgi:outer membrane protein assembly factor BamB